MTATRTTPDDELAGMLRRIADELDPRTGDGAASLDPDNELAGNVAGEDPYAGLTPAVRLLTAEVRALQHRCDELDQRAEAADLAAVDELDTARRTRLERTHVADRCHDLLVAIEALGDPGEDGLKVLDQLAGR